MISMPFKPPMISTSAASSNRTRGTIPQESFVCFVVWL